MKILKLAIYKTYAIINSNKHLKRFKPVVEAADEFFFGTDKVTLFTPHIEDGIDIKRYMSFVIIGLLPATIASIYFFGPRVIAMIAVSYIFGGLTEVVFSAVRRKPVHEGFLVTGLIFPLVLPPLVPLWMVALGVVFGVMFGKEVFGGTGRNIFNPALVGRVFVSLAFPSVFSASWKMPLSDTITSATPLVGFKSAHAIPDLYSLLLGSQPGSIGEVFRIGIIAGGIFLILVKIIDWRIPLSYLGMVFIFASLGNKMNPEVFAPAAFQLLAGGLLFGAFFMATDPVTSPFTKTGRWVYGILLGVITVSIRSLSGFVEGVMFSILLMNAFAPLIDTIVVNLRFKEIRK